MTLSYYTGDQVAAITQGTGEDRVHTTYALDVAGRRVSETVEAYSYPVGGVRSPYTTQTWHAYGDPTGDNPVVSWDAYETTYHYPGLSAALLSVFRFDDGSSRTQYLTNPHGDTVAEVQYTLGGPAYLGSTFADYGDYGETTIPEYGRGNPARPTWHGGAHRLTTGHGLTLMGARLYNPTTAHFTTPDPIPGGNTTPYTYPQNPVTDSDTTGMCTSRKWWCIKGILRGRESLPSGLRNFLKKTGRGTYIWYRPDGAKRRGITGDDGCTSPAQDYPSGFPFKPACDTHDLGYALIRYHNITLKPWGVTKWNVDVFFAGDLYAQCALVNWSKRTACYRTADKYFTGVRFYSG
jgi:RHS repeat-associated protein